MGGPPTRTRPPVGQEQDVEGAWGGLQALPQQLVVGGECGFRKPRLCLGQSVCRGMRRVIMA